MGAAEGATSDSDGASAPQLVASALAAGRLAIGAGIWLAPGLSARALGFDPLDHKGLALGRIAATRDLVMGAWLLAALDDRDSLRRAAAATAIADAGDALTFALLLGGRGELRGAGLRGLAGAVPAAAAGLWLTRRLGR
jgi:hypothetical protein